MSRDPRRLDAHLLARGPHRDRRPAVAGEPMTCDVCSHPEHGHQVATARSPRRPCMVCPCTDYAPFVQAFGPLLPTDCAYHEHCDGWHTPDGRPRIEQEFT